MQNLKRDCKLCIWNRSLFNIYDFKHWFQFSSWFSGNLFLPWKKVLFYEILKFTIFEVLVLSYSGFLWKFLVHLAESNNGDKPFLFNSQRTKTHIASFFLIYPISKFLRKTTKGEFELEKLPWRFFFFLPECTLAFQIFLPDFMELLKKIAGRTTMIRIESSFVPGKDQTTRIFEWRVSFDDRNFII